MRRFNIHRHPSHRLSNPAPERAGASKCCEIHNDEWTLWEGFQTLCNADSPKRRSNT